MAKNSNNYDQMTSKDCIEFHKFNNHFKTKEGKESLNRIYGVCTQKGIKELIDKHGWRHFYKGFIPK